MPDPPAIDGPVRILGVVANPADTAPLDVAAERARVERAVADVVALGPRDARLAGAGDAAGACARCCATASYHVLHYVGHGDFTPAGEGVLYLEDGGDGAGTPSSTAASWPACSPTRPRCGSSC